MYKLKTVKLVTIEEVTEREVSLEVYIGHRVAELRNSLGINASELSRRSFEKTDGEGISGSYISTIESGSSTINLAKLKVVALTLGVDVTELLPCKTEYTGQLQLNH